MVKHPLVERYVTRLETELGSLACPESQDIVDEIRNHIAEASAVGRPLDAILEALGPADILARAYAVELALNPRDRRVRAFTKFIQLAGLVAVTSFGALIVVGGLGLVGIGFSASGLVMFVIGVLESADIHLPGVQMNGISPMWAIAFWSRRDFRGAGHAGGRSGLHPLHGWNVASGTPAGTSAGEPGRIK